MQTQLVTELWRDLSAALLSLPTWQGFLLVVGCSVVAAKLIQVGGDVVIRRFTRRIPGEIDDVVFASIHPPLYVSVVLVGSYLAVWVLGVVPDWIGWLQAGVLTAITLMWAVALARMGRRVSEEATRDERFDNQVVPIFQNIWSIALLIVTSFLVLSYWRIDVTPLLASAGILGIVLGFAARDTIANFFGSLALYADRTYAVGDFVVLESGERGRVEDISIRSTDIRTRDDLLVTVPNSVLNTATIINESAQGRERRVRIPVGVAYGSDLDHVEAVLQEAAAEESLVIEDPEPRVRVRGFGDSAVDVELLCWISDPVLRGRASHRLFKGVYAAFDEAGIEIPYPQRVVTMAGDDTAGPTDNGHRPAAVRTDAGGPPVDGPRDGDS